MTISIAAGHGDDGTAYVVECRHCRARGPVVDKYIRGGLIREKEGHYAAIQIWNLHKAI